MTKTIGDRLRAVEAAETEDFVELTKIAGLDPATAFRDMNLAGINFSGQDLSGFNLSGSNLDGCQFDGAKITGAILDEDHLLLPQLRAAADFRTEEAMLLPLPTSDRHQMAGSFAGPLGAVSLGGPAGPLALGGPSGPAERAFAFVSFPEERPEAFEQELNSEKLKLTHILDVAHQSFTTREHPAAAIVDRLVCSLHNLRNQVNPAIWQHLIPVAQRHPVSEFLWQDPFTFWSFQKPRGYSGDGKLLDISYKHPSVDRIVASSTELGQEIYAYTSEAASSVAGRERRDILARTVDATAERVENAEVLAIACGHLREAELSWALAEKKLKRWVGLDQDPISVGIVNRDLAGTAVEAIDGSVKGILRRAYKLGTFDLVYASGLYDYLPRAVGIWLMQRAMEFVKPGGEFLFANFSDEITTDGYMATFMDWQLMLRSADDMWGIINGAVDKNTVDAEVFYGTNRNIVYGKVRKR